MSGLVERLDRVVAEWRRTADLVEELAPRLAGHPAAGLVDQLVVRLSSTCLATTALIAAIAEERKS